MKYLENLRFTRYIKLKVHRSVKLKNPMKNTMSGPEKPGDIPYVF